MLDFSQLIGPAKTRSRRISLLIAVMLNSLSAPVLSLCASSGFLHWFFLFPLPIFQYLFPNPRSFQGILLAPTIVLQRHASDPAHLADSIYDYKPLFPSPAHSLLAAWHVKPQAWFLVQVQVQVQVHFLNIHLCFFPSFLSMSNYIHPDDLEDISFSSFHLCFARCRLSPSSRAGVVNR